MKARRIREKLEEIFPNLVVPWLRDPEYLLPTVQEVEDFVKESNINEYHFKTDTFDCDDFALQLHAEVKMNHHWAFGEAYADRVKGQEMRHNLNVFIASTGVIYLLEPQTDEIWKAIKEQDNVLIIGM